MALNLDATPVSIWIETLSGGARRLIGRNVPLPTGTSRVFTTTSDSQTEIEVRVLQGECEFASDDEILAVLVVGDIPPAPRGIPQIEVQFDIDADGLLDVKAKDRATGREQQVRITASSMLSKDEIDKMVRHDEGGYARRLATELPT